MAQNGKKLYVPYLGSEPLLPESGAVAILDVNQLSATKLLEAILDPSPTCMEDEECVVLATIHDVALGGEDPAARRVTDDKISNLEGRKILPSTSLLTEVMTCLLESDEV